MVGVWYFGETLLVRFWIPCFFFLFILLPLLFTFLFFHFLLEVLTLSLVPFGNLFTCSFFLLSIYTRDITPSEG